jgi:hypothetical protein
MFVGNLGVGWRDSKLVQEPMIRMGVFGYG